MKIAFSSILTILCFSSAVQIPTNTTPIDVVIPCIEKDLTTLELSIAGIKKHGTNIGRIFTISPKKLSKNAIWIDESLFPFSKMDIGVEIFGNKKRAAAYMKKPYNRIGWAYQQLLKVYAHTVIPNLSPHFLILDADIIFLRPVTFFDGSSPLYAHSSENTLPYFAFMSRLLPGLEKVFPDKSGVVHHMLFSKSVLNQLFANIRQEHTDCDSVWKAFIKCIDIYELQQSCMSEYEIYFNYIFTHSAQPKLRNLTHISIDDSALSQIPELENGNYDFASCPHYQHTHRKPPIRFLAPSKRPKFRKSL